MHHFKPGNCHNFETLMHLHLNICSRVLSKLAHVSIRAKAQLGRTENFDLGCFGKIFVRFKSLDSSWSLQQKIFRKLVNHIWFVVPKKGI